VNVATERLALLSALLLPITPPSSIYGMSIIVNEHTQPDQIIVAIVMISAVMLTWTKRRGGGEQLFAQPRPAS